jgi:hypothetical protein
VMRHNIWDQLAFVRVRRHHPCWDGNQRGGQTNHNNCHQRLGVRSSVIRSNCNYWMTFAIKLKSPGKTRLLDVHARSGLGFHSSITSTWQSSACRSRTASCSRVRRRNLEETASFLHEVGVTMPQLSGFVGADVAVHFQIDG